MIVFILVVPSLLGFKSDNLNIPFCNLCVLREKDLSPLENIRSTVGEHSMTSEQSLLLQKRRRRKRKAWVEDSKIYLKKRKTVHEIPIPEELVEFARKEIELIDYILFDSPIASKLRHPATARTITILLYARAKGIPISRVAKQFNIAHEQLYRIERLLEKAGIKEDVYREAEKLLTQPEEGKKRRRRKK